MVIRRGDSSWQEDAGRGKGGGAPSLFDLAWDRVEHPAIAEHPPGPNTEARSLGGRVEWGAEWDAGWRGDSSWQEWRGGWWYRDASGGWVEWQNPWRVQAHMPA